MLGPLQTFLGFEQETLLLVTGIIAAIVTFGSMVLVLFFTFAPYVSEGWRSELGVGDAGSSANKTE